MNLSQAQADALRKDPEYEFYAMKLAKGGEGVVCVLESTA